MILYSCFSPVWTLFCKLSTGSWLILDQRFSACTKSSGDITHRIKIILNPFRNSQGRRMWMDCLFDVFTAWSFILSLDTCSIPGDLGCNFRWALPGLVFHGMSPRTYSAFLAEIIRRDFCVKSSNRNSPLRAKKWNFKVIKTMLAQSCLAAWYMLWDQKLEGTVNPQPKVDFRLESQMGRKYDSCSHKPFQYTPSVVKSLF